MIRVGLVVGLIGAVMLAGCAGTGPGREGASKPTLAAVTPEYTGPDLPVDISLDQAALDEAIRKAKAFEALVARAEGGDEDAQFELAERYAHGRDVDKDPEEAKHWYLAAADQGHEKSRALLVEYYINNTLFGYEPKTDFVRLLPWLKDAAKTGNVVAQEILAQKYAQGQEVPQDLWEAQRWLQALADRGFVNAQYSLAVMYHQGLGVEKDPRTAYKWFEAAAKQGDGRSQYMVALMNYYGRGVSQSHSTALDWAKKAAQQDDAGIRQQAVTLIHILDKIEASKPKPPPMKPLIGKDGKPVLDKDGKPVMVPDVPAAAEPGKDGKAPGAPAAPAAPGQPQSAAPATQPALPADKPEAPAPKQQ